MTEQSQGTAPVAIVTGGGRGMGAAIARELHARGYRLALMSPSGSAETLATELGGFGLSGSVEKPADMQALVEATDRPLRPHRRRREPPRGTRRRAISSTSSTRTGRAAMT